MFNQLLKIISNFLEQTGLLGMESEFNIIVAAITIISTACTLIVLMASHFIKYCIAIIRWLRRKKTVDFLYKALSRHSIVSKKDLIYQIRSYRTPKFDDGRTFNQLLKQIKKSSGARNDNPSMFSIVGYPACGKTTTMRYLYCALAKKRSCIYIQMQDIISMQGVRNYLYEQKSVNQIPDGTSVVAFFDGLDEAYRFFQEENPSSMEEALKSLFFGGIYSKIFSAFKEANLFLDCAIISLRPEFLERSIQSLESTQNKYIDTMVYRMMPMSDRDVIKTFKSLRLLKKLTAKLDKSDELNRKRYPPFGQCYKYTRLFRKILKENPDCLFHYPMYIRYAYPFMQRYMKKQEEGNHVPKLSDNFALSFEILMEAIIEWELHIYYDKKLSCENSDEWKELKASLNSCAQESAKALAEHKEWYLSKGDFTKIIKQFFPDELQGLAIAHCFMASDDKGEKYEFCHKTFFEYYLAQYLLFTDNYRFRKEQFSSTMVSENLRDMYYSILCKEKPNFNMQVSESIEHMGNGVLIPDQYRALELQKLVKVKNSPSISMVEMLEYIPCIKKFMYQAEEFTPSYLERIMDTGYLNLETFDWQSLECGRGIINPNRVIRLNISRMPLENAYALSKYENLKQLDFRFLNEESLIIDEILSIIRKHPFEWLHIYSETGLLCTRIQELISKGEVQAERIRVQTLNYCQAYNRIYQINQAYKENGQSIKFFLSHRTNLDVAKERYGKEKTDAEGELIEAVFELEAEENGELGLDKEDAKATLWNGLTLAYYYQERYGIDDWSVHSICSRMKPYIQKDESELSIRYGNVYGKTLYHQHEYGLAKEWLLYSYVRSEKYLCEWCMAKLGLVLYRAWIFSKTVGIEQFESELGDKLKQLPDYQKTWHYTEFLRCRSGKAFDDWKKGKSPTPGLETMLTEYRKCTALRYKDNENSYNMVNTIYFDLIYANRTENVSLGRKLLQVFFETIRKNTNNPHFSESEKQFDYMRYLEQKLYHHFLQDKKDVVQNLAKKLLDYPYCREVLALSDYMYISDSCKGEKADTEVIDRHKLWYRVWY